MVPTKNNYKDRNDPENYLRKSRAPLYNPKMPDEKSRYFRMRYDVKTAIRNVQAGSLQKLLKSVNIPAPATRKNTSSNKLKKLAATNLKSVFAVKRSTVRRKIKAKRKLQETL